MGTVTSYPVYVWNSAISILDEIVDEEEMHSIEVQKGSFIIQFIEAKDIPPVDFLSDPNPFLRSFLAMVSNTEKQCRCELNSFFLFICLFRTYHQMTTLRGNIGK